LRCLFFLDKLFTSLFVHDWEYLIEDCLDGTCWSWSLSRWVLMKVHISWIGLVALSRKIHLWKRADMDALMRGCTELATTFCQTFNATWSATPGAGKHLSTSDGRFVKNKSSVALCLVEKLTICSRPQFWVQSSSLWLIATALEFNVLLSRITQPQGWSVRFCCMCVFLIPYIWSRYQESDFLGRRRSQPSWHQLDHPSNWWKL
jgi:hypothetical protein